MSLRGGLSWVTPSLAGSAEAVRSWGRKRGDQEQEQQEQEQQEQEEIRLFRARMPDGGAGVRGRCGWPRRVAVAAGHTCCRGPLRAAGRDGRGTVEE